MVGKGSKATFAKRVILNPDLRQDRLDSESTLRTRFDDPGFLDESSIPCSFVLIPRNKCRGSHRTKKPLLYENGWKCLSFRILCND